MPFQVSYSTKKGRPVDVLLLSAGLNQLIYCGSTISLEATVNDIAKLPGHYLLWEQLEGLPVILDTPNALTASYPFTETSDKVFRFWIDKGTAYQQYDDVIIFHTPTSVCPISQDTDGYAVVLSLNTSPVDCNDIVSSVIVTAPPPTSNQGEDPSGAIIQIIIDWEHPGDPIKDVYIEQYVVVEDNIDVAFIPPIPIPDAGDGTGPPVGTLTYDGMLAVYRIDTKYNVSGIQSTVPSCDKDFSSLVIPITKIYNDSVWGVSQNDTGYSLSTTNFGFIVLHQSDDISMSSDDDEYSIDITTFTFIVIQNQNSPISMGTNDTEYLLNITRYDPQGIGGGP